MKIKFLFLLLVTLTLISCYITKGQKIGLIIRDVQKFRDAEQIYKDKYGNGSFGNVNELIDKKLLETRFADLEEQGYRFNLTLENEHFNLSVVPMAEENKAKSDDDEELSLFVDESGVIRANVKRNIPANSQSSSISSK